jgi:DNA-binding PadR family transcriptional regulator
MAMIQEAVLALIAREPSHGYALWQTLRSVSADPDSVQTSSVYTALKRLDEAGAIEVVGDAPTRGSGERPRFTYGTTDIGHERARKWMVQRPSSSEELRLRIALAQPVDDLSDLIEWVAADLGETQRRLGAAPGAQRSSLGCATSWETACAIALSALEFRELSARAQWLAECHAQLQKLRELALSLRS